MLPPSPARYPLWGVSWVGGTLPKPLANCDLQLVDIGEDTPFDGGAPVVLQLRFVRSYPPSSDRGTVALAGWPVKQGKSTEGAALTPVPLAMGRESPSRLCQERWRKPYTPQEPVFAEPEASQPKGAGDKG